MIPTGDLAQKTINRWLMVCPNGQCLCSRTFFSISNNFAVRYASAREEFDSKKSQPMNPMAFPAGIRLRNNSLRSRTPRNEFVYFGWWRFREREDAAFLAKMMSIAS